MQGSQTLKKHEWEINSQKSVATCSACDYHVAVSKDEETKGGSKHVPEERIIYTDRVSVMDVEHATYLCKVWGIRCNS